MLNYGKWIWATEHAQPDEHAEFLAKFEYKKPRCKKKVTLYISADSDYVCYLNGETVDFGQYADYPHYKVYDELDLTGKLQDGENVLAVEAWYFGADTQTYIQGKAGVWFVLAEGNKVLLASGTDTLARLSKTYRNYEKKSISMQLGYTYAYDATKEDGWKTQGGKDFCKAYVREDVLPLFKRPVEKLVNGAPVVGELIKQEKGYALYDFGQETVGIPRIRFACDRAQTVTLAYGEHIADGKVRRKIANRDFSIEYVAKAGENDFTGCFRRLGLRYLEVHSETDLDGLTVEMIPRLYPVTVQPYEIADETLQKIYDVSVHTLRCCMHEHYEDCPWREQALYNMDSRNQMLFGYYAFQEYAFPRANLKLMAQDRREDGLLAICFPCGIDLTIPSFGLHFFTQVREYADYSGDWDFVKEILPKLQSVLQTFTDRIAANGLQPTFVGANYWNFYEWADGLEGSLGQAEEEKFDLVLNTLLSIALQHMQYMCNKIGVSSAYGDMAGAINQKINETFYCQADGAYAMYENTRQYSELGNALAVLCGACVGDSAKAIAEKLAGANDWTKATLSMKVFKYDALLAVDESAYRGYVLDDIRAVYTKMLSAGATTFWETELGEADFEKAGSLCHGWSALPIYYFHRLNVK